MKKLIVILFVILCINVNAKSSVTLDSCVDGDTAWFNYNGRREKFRFLALDTPETVHPTKSVEDYGKDASEYTCNLLSNASEIVVQFDDGSDILDKYNRYLAWIWIDGELLQEKLISVGYGKVAYVYGDYMYTESLCKVQNKAYNEKLGLWLDDVTQGYCDTIDFSNADNIEYIEKKENNNSSIIGDAISKYPLLAIILVVAVYLLKKKRK